MKRLAAVGAAGADQAMLGPVAPTGVGAAPVGRGAEKSGGRQSQAASFAIWAWTSGNRWVRLGATLVPDDPRALRISDHASNRAMLAGLKNVLKEMLPASTSMKRVVSSRDWATFR